MAVDTEEAKSHPAESESDTSSLFYDSLSSSEDSQHRDAEGDAAPSRQAPNLALKRHIGDTIDRLQEQANRIERAGAQHRRRVERYQQQERPKQVYEGYQKFGRWKANEQFTLASETIRERIAESFARRRIRFEYVKEHQKKRAAAEFAQTSTSVDPTLQIDNDDLVALATPGKKVSKKRDTANTPYPVDQQTLFSATINTKYDFRLEPTIKERAESVRSVVLQHAGFPPPPHIEDGKFVCPYCLLEFSAREAEKGRWR